ncbi:ParB N-terminal domain-containing protein [Marivita sp. S0852]|uniref:ParB N-terminal domain-containing protein n=1 Tax=Marivita sp. S0852 TaxID=3373893 RepID=UPI003982A051
MSSKNKFGFAPLDTAPTPARRERSPGPMGAAVRDTAENLQEATEAKVEQRRRNAEDAKAFRAAQEDGLVLERLPVGDIQTDDLPRDRLQLEVIAQSDEMEELKSSIRERGQKEPIEVYVGADGAFQLKKGWRRLTALRQLLGETGDDAFAEVVARVERTAEDRISRYIDMVEENVVREDLSFAEMAQVAITASLDKAVGEPDPNELVNRLYGSLHKTKRSYIKGFVFMMMVLGDSLKFPKAISRNLGVEVSRAITNKAAVEALRIKLEAVTTPDAQNDLLSAFVKESKALATSESAEKPPRQKFEFYVGKTKVTARDGECRIVSDRDFATIPKSALERAVAAFEEALTAQPRVRSLE